MPSYGQRTLDRLSREPELQRHSRLGRRHLIAETPSSAIPPLDLFQRDRQGSNLTAQHSFRHIDPTCTSKGLNQLIRMVVIGRDLVMLRTDTTRGYVCFCRR